MIRSSSIALPPGDDAESGEGAAEEGRGGGPAGFSPGSLRASQVGLGTLTPSADNAYSGGIAIKAGSFAGVATGRGGATVTATTCGAARRGIACLALLAIPVPSGFGIGPRWVHHKVGESDRRRDIVRRASEQTDQGAIFGRIAFQFFEESSIHEQLRIAASSHYP